MPPNGRTTAQTIRAPVVAIYQKRRIRHPNHNTAKKAGRSGIAESAAVLG